MPLRPIAPHAAPPLTVEIWTLSLRGLEGDAIARAERVLGPAERARAERLQVTRARHEHIAGQALLRWALSRTAGGAPADWRFGRGRHGKPYLEPQPDGHDLRFNLSHTHGLAACALTHGVEVGVDIEAAHRRTKLDVAGRYFAPEEVAQLKRARPESRPSLFLAFWTLKEAYIKGIGLGLARRLHGFAFDLERPTGPAGPGFRVLDDAPDAADQHLWTFRRGRPTADHLLALAVAAGREREVDLRWHHLDALPDLGAGSGTG